MRIHGYVAADQPTTLCQKIRTRVQRYYHLALVGLCGTDLD